VFDKQRTIKNIHLFTKKRLTLVKMNIKYDAVVWLIDNNKQAEGENRPKGTEFRQRSAGSV
jgi:hypothetical protein